MPIRQILTLSSVINFFAIARSQPRILANQRMNAIGDFLGTFSGIEGTPGMKGTTASPAKRLKRKQVVL
jgi:hypothetical protein